MCWSTLTSGSSYILAHKKQIDRQALFNCYISSAMSQAQHKLDTYTAKAEELGSTITPQDKITGKYLLVLL